MTKTSFLKRSLKGVAVAICLAGSATMCFAQETGVVINGVTWATCNVDKPGTFAAKPESAGMFYQWNRKVAYAATGDVANWNTSELTGTEWEAANDPSPAGWRVPTMEEFKSLLDRDNVEQEWDKTKKGVIFTDKETGASIFIPAVGYRESAPVKTLFGTVIKNAGELSDAEGDYPKGYYWSSTPYDVEEYKEYNFISFLKLSSLVCCGSRGGTSRNKGCMIRPVMIDAPVPIWKSNIIGVWKGNYRQSKVTVIVNDDMTGVLDFETSNGLLGKHKISVRYSMGTYSIKGTEWVEQTGNFNFLNLDGKISDGTFSGESFNLEKQN